MSYNNWYSTISSFLNICYLVKLFANKSTFEEQLGWDDAKNKLPDLFANSIISLARDVLLADYINSSQGNWETIYISTRDKNKVNNANIVDNNTNTVEERGRNMENNDNFNF